MSDELAVKRSMLLDRNTRWRTMFRIEDVGGGTQPVTDAINSHPFEHLVYAEGDSWFDKFTPLLTAGTNLLDAIRTPYYTGVVDVSHIGDEVRDMVRGHQGRQTAVLFDMFDFKAILLSAGGNDLKNLFADLFERKARSEAGLPTVLSEDEIRRLETPSRFTEFFDEVVQNIERFVGLRDGARSATTRSAPIFLHGYDYLQPRPAGAVIFAGTRIGRGPWLYPSLRDAGLSDAAMRSVADAVIDELNNRLQAVIAQLPNVHVIDQRGLLTPGEPGSDGPSNDWMDEIHPTAAGYETLARNRWDVRLARALGWQFAANETEPALEPGNPSTALAEPPPPMA